VKDLLPARLEASVWDRDYKISKPQYIQSGVF